MNIWQLEQNLLNLFDELEENGGELTPELEEELNITQESFTNKVKDYTCVIKSIENDLSAIKAEQKRLKELSDSKAKVIDRLKKIIIDAIEKFGSTKKSGVKFIDYGTGQVSIRQSTAVDVDEDAVKKIGIALVDIMEWYKFDNQLDVYDKVNLSELIDVLAETKVNAASGEEVVGIEMNPDEVKNVNINVEFKVPISKLVEGEGYKALSEIYKYTSGCKLTPSVDKTALKDQLKQDGSCMPHMAKLQTNKNIVIK